jgi:serine/threonine protein kinase
VPPSAKHADLGVEIGQVFLGKYRVDAILGQGGMGIVAQCHHLQLDERVAIKMLKPDVLGDRDAVQRFLREAQAAAKLKSEHVARVVDVGEFETGVPYMVMEFLEGYDLGQAIDSGQLLSVQLVADLALQACEALAEAHSLGIIHRDVKPTNLFVVRRADKPILKVLDFGISKTQSGSDLKLTQTQSLLGTPAYMSPEQMRSAREVDARTDLWSLGTVMYEALEGRRPFEAESFSEMVVKVSMEPPAPMHNTPPALQQIVLRCLCKQPDQRFQTMAELGRELIPFAPDPHAAQSLVERMYRLLRRSQVMLPGQEGWEGVPTGTGPKLPLGAGNAVPQSQAQVPPSSPIPAPPIVPTQHGVGPPGAVVQPVQQAGSQPVAAMSLGWQGASGPGTPDSSQWAGGSGIGADPWHGVTGTDPHGRPMSAVHDARRMSTTTVPVTRPVPLGVKIGVLAFATVLGALVAILVGGKSKDGKAAAEAKPSSGSAVVQSVGAAHTVTVPPPVTNPPPPPPAALMGSGSATGSATADVSQAGQGSAQPQSQQSQPQSQQPQVLTSAQLKKQHDDALAKKQHDDALAKKQHDDQVKKQHDDQVKKQHDDALAKKQHDDELKKQHDDDLKKQHDEDLKKQEDLKRQQQQQQTKPNGLAPVLCPNGHPVDEYSHGCPNT